MRDNETGLSRLSSNQRHGVSFHSVCPTIRNPNCESLSPATPDSYLWPAHRQSIRPVGRKVYLRRSLILCIPLLKGACSCCSLDSCMKLQRPYDDEIDWNSLYKETLEQCELADQVGFDNLWFVEHHFLYGFSRLALSRGDVRRPCPSAPRTSASGSACPSCPITTRCASPSGPPWWTS